MLYGFSFNLLLFYKSLKDDHNSFLDLFFKNSLRYEKFELLLNTNHLFCKHSWLIVLPQHLYLDCMILSRYSSILSTKFSFKYLYPIICLILNQHLLKNESLSNDEVRNYWFLETFIGFQLPPLNQFVFFAKCISTLWQEQEVYQHSLSIS